MIRQNDADHPFLISEDEVLLRILRAEAWKIYGQVLRTYNRELVAARAQHATNLAALRRYEK